jgi:hypothetical protein
VNYWQQVHDYFLSQGVPEVVLRYVCISPGEAAQIASLIEERQPRIILEVGTYIGISTGVIALAKRAESRLVCVDPNLPVDILSAKLNYVDGRGAFAFVQPMLAHFGKAEEAVLLEGFLSCLPHDAAQIRAQLRQRDIWGIPIVGEQICQYAPYDLVFLDGDHSAISVYRDLKLLAPCLSESGGLTWYWSPLFYVSMPASSGVERERVLTGAWPGNNRR